MRNEVVRRINRGVPGRQNSPGFIRKTSCQPAAKRLIDCLKANLSRAAGGLTRVGIAEEPMLVRSYHPVVRLQRAWCGIDAPDFSPYLYPHLYSGGLAKRRQNDRPDQRRRYAASRGAAPGRARVALAGGARLWRFVGNVKGFIPGSLTARLAWTSVRFAQGIITAPRRDLPLQAPQGRGVPHSFGSRSMAGSWERAEWNRPPALPYRHVTPLADDKRPWHLPEVAQ
jgi:hypothetical protein